MSSTGLGQPATRSRFQNVVRGAYQTHQYGSAQNLSKYPQKDHDPGMVFIVHIWHNCIKIQTHVMLDVLRWQHNLRGTFSRTPM